MGFKILIDDAEIQLYEDAKAYRSKSYNYERVLTKIFGSLSKWACDCGNEKTIYIPEKQSSICCEKCGSLMYPDLKHVSKDDAPEIVDVKFKEMQSEIDNLKGNLRNSYIHLDRFMCSLIAAGEGKDISIRGNKSYFTLQYNWNKHNYYVTIPADVFAKLNFLPTYWAVQQTLEKLKEKNLEGISDDMLPAAESEDMEQEGNTVINAHLEDSDLEKEEDEIIYNDTDYLPKYQQ